MTDPTHRILVPVGESDTIRNTVAYAADEARREAEEGTGGVTLHFVYPVAWERYRLAGGGDDAGEEDLLDRVRTWANSDLGGEEGDDGPEGESGPPVGIETATVGGDRYLFSPVDYADVLIEYAEANGVDRVILDPEYSPGVRAPLLMPLEAELGTAGLDYEEAPVERAVRGRRLLSRSGDLASFLATFGLSFLFYLVVAGRADAFNLATGAFSAAIVASVLSGMTFERSIRPVWSARALLRWGIYGPYLLWEIAKANLEVAYVVLHPSLPIDPGMIRFQPAVFHGLPVTTLANSITLTPGTLTVDVRQRDFHIHTLTGSARKDLLEGGLERAVRFVFYGRDAARIPSPRERMAEEVASEEPVPDHDGGAEPAAPGAGPGSGPDGGEEDR